MVTPAVGAVQGLQAELTVPRALKAGNYGMTSELLSQPFPSPTLGLSPAADDPRPKQEHQTSGTVSQVDSKEVLRSRNRAFSLNYFLPTPSQICFSSRILHLMLPFSSSPNSSLSLSFQIISKSQNSTFPRLIVASSSLSSLAFLELQPSL